MADMLVLKQHSISSQQKNAHMVHFIPIKPMLCLRKQPQLRLAVSLLSVVVVKWKIMQLTYNSTSPSVVKQVTMAFK